MKPLHSLLILFTVATWGFSFVVMRVVLEVFSPGQLAVTRSLLSLLVLLPFWKPLRGLPLKLAAAALAIGGLSYLALYSAVSVTDSLTTVAIVTQLMPVLSAVMALALYREPVSARKWLGIAVATLGAMYLAGATESSLSVMAIGLTMLSILFYSFGSVVIGKSGDMGVWNFLAWAAALSLPPLGLWVGATGPLFPDPGLLSARHWLALLFVVLLSALLAQAVLFRLYRIYPVSEVVPWVLLIPIFAGLSSVLVYAERITATLVLGGGVVLAGVWIQQHRPRRKQRGPG